MIEKIPKNPEIDYEYHMDIINEVCSLPTAWITTISRYEDKTLTHRLIVSNLGYNDIILPTQGKLKELTLYGICFYFNDLVYEKYPYLKEKDIIKSVAFPNLQFRIAPYSNKYNEIPQLDILDYLCNIISEREKKYNTKAQVLQYFIVDNIDIFRFLSHNPSYRDYMAYYDHNTRVLTVNE